MKTETNRPVLILLTSHWVSMLGVALVSLAGFSWLFVLPMHTRGNAGNPYIGLLVFFAIPIVFFAGLALIPVGIALSRRRIEEAFERRAAWRRVGVFFVSTTFLNVIIGSQVTYRAVERMDTVQFCGGTCHVMKPEFTAYGLGTHSEVECVDCHVAPGAEGWVESKMAGTRQLLGVIFNSYPRPIESAMESDRLVSSAVTCEQCHAREMFIGPRLRILTEYNDDEANTRTETVLMMLVGGGKFGGIHGKHMGPGIHISYAAQDQKRQTLPWVEYRDNDSGVSRTYRSAGAKADTTSNLPKFEMQCVDCHNRAAHAFQVAERAVDVAITTKKLASDLPFVKKVGVGLISAGYVSDQEAGQKIPSGLTSFYQHKYPDVASKRAQAIQAAGEALLSIYQNNIFPDLKVTWGTYPNNLGHTNYPGCFRCHDGDHVTSNNESIPQDCGVCHQLLAVGEKSPNVLKTLGLAGTLTSVRQ